MDYEEIPKEDIAAIVPQKDIAKPREWEDFEREEEARKAGIAAIESTQKIQAKPQPLVKPLEWSEGYGHESKYGQYVYQVFQDGLIFWAAASESWNRLLKHSNPLKSEKEAMEWADEQYENFFLSRLNQ